MIIKLLGLGTVNKGSYLMLLSILEYFRKSSRGEDFFFVAYFRDNFPKAEGAAEGVHELFVTKRRNIEVGPFIRLIPLELRKKVGLVTECDVDVILDASGFRYGDQWSPISIRSRLSNEIESLKLQKKKIILMPQAFGPFERKEVLQEVQKIVDHADLIFARDDISLRYLEEAFGKRDNIKQAPDFTNLLDEGTPADRGKSNDVIIIPNSKLLEETEIAKQDLLRSFQKIVEEVRSADLQPVILIHAGASDEQLAEEINTFMDTPVSVIMESDPRKQKKIIGSAYAVITGRFHGLVSALSQEVPAAALSWSHKYEMLLKDYGQEKYLFQQGSSKNELILQELLNKSRNSEIREELRIKSDLQKERSLKMWKEIEKVIFAS